MKIMNKNKERIENNRKNLSILIDICKVNLKNSDECLTYLREKRGLTDSIIDKYNIGFFPQNTGKLSQFVSPEVLERLSIMEYSGKSKFSDFYYLIFPIYDEYNNPVGINGRTLFTDDKREILRLSKYENSSYKKSQILYGLNHARGAVLSEQNIFICEGNFDVIQLQKNQIKNSVAICGTAFSKEHFIRLARYSDKFTFILDNDDAGKNAAYNINKKFANKGISLKFMSLPNDCKDVDDFFMFGNSKLDFLNTLQERNMEIENMEWE